MATGTAFFATLRVWSRTAGLKIDAGRVEVDCMGSETLQLLADAIDDHPDLAAGVGEDLLLVEDDDIDALVAQRHIEQIGKRSVRRAESLGAAIDCLSEAKPGVILADLTLEDACDLEVVETLIEYAPFVPVIVATGIDSDDLAVAALELGAQDYLVKGEYTRAQLGRALRHARSRHRLLVKLARSQADLGHAKDDMRDVSAILAHDLRAPVRSARLLADRFFTRLDGTDPETLESKRRIDESLGRVEHLIASILDFESLRSGQPNLSPVELAAVTHEAIELLSADIQTVAVRVGVHIAPGLEVIANYDLLLRVFVNLISNAIKYRRLDLRCLIEIRANVVGDRAVVTIADNGKGIPAPQREKVFKMAHRLEGGDIPGLGFGLPVCRQIIERLNGTIEVVPSNTPGTTVTFNLDLLT